MSESLNPGFVALVSVWVLVFGAGAAYRYCYARRRLDRHSARAVAEGLGLTFDPHCIHGSVGAFGQLPDGRAVRLYEEHRRGHTGLFPWHKQTCTGSILEVGVEAEAWEQLNADERDAARALMSTHFHDSLDRYREQLLGLGFTTVTLAGGVVRLKAGKRLPSSEGMVRLLEALGRIAAETEAACVEHVLTGRRPAGGPVVAASGASAQAQAAATSQGLADETGDVAYVPAPWKCEDCEALNPADVNRCQMCSTERSRIRQAGE